ncbi:uncharacterized protein LOC119735011 [Patiria miniata]|uniref:RRM domain-containing protein n=1 Tax=Patiria miniata TaxID=46514 RepID=A0A914AM04_PATMI|nr:uncharacterized protein LOC119735011 [Patiria miniata]XP_038064616.1 uncharacterized protein LOC119735011 [Patiria miniata]XP_038064618.1 uncharacterized protein LOC119735011 [Patiria miniata]
MTEVRVKNGRVDAAPWKPDLNVELEDEDVFKSDFSDSFATPPKYVTSIGRGARKRPDPCNIRLPRIYFDMLRQKHNSRRPAGRGSVVRNFSGQNLPGSLQPQDSVQMVNQPRTIPSSSLSENFLGAATRGLTSEILEGKACLMEKFLGKPMGGAEGFNPFRDERQRSTGSLRSTHTAPVLDFNSREQWPGVGAAACQSDCGRGGPRKSYSLQDALNAISSVPAEWDKGSLDSSRRGSGEGSKRWRKGKKRQGGSQETREGCQEKEAPRTNASEGAVASSTSGSTHPENGSRERSSGGSVTGTSQNQDRAMPGGPNLIQVECLPENITEQRLESVMYGFGAVIACDILRDSDSGNCIGIAFVRFENSDACLSAISALHGEESPFHDCGDGKEIPKLLIHLVT